MSQKIKLSTKSISTTPLTVYHIPCNETSSVLPTGFGQCPATLTIAIPIFSRKVIRYIPWIVPTNQSTLNLHYQSLKIPPRLRLNKATINALDQTINRIQGPLNHKLQVIRSDIDAIQVSSDTTTTQVAAYVALTFALVNTVLFITLTGIMCRRFRNRPHIEGYPTVKYVKESESLHLDPPLSGLWRRSQPTSSRGLGNRWTTIVIFYRSDFFSYHRNVYWLHHKYLHPSKPNFNQATKWTLNRTLYAFLTMTLQWTVPSSTRISLYAF